LFQSGTNISEIFGPGGPNIPLHHPQNLLLYTYKPQELCRDILGGMKMKLAYSYSQVVNEI